LEVLFKIFDTDYVRAQWAEKLLLSGLKARGIEGKVHLVFEHLEFSRKGLKDIPALELNGIILFQGQGFSDRILEDILKRLVIAQRKMSFKYNNNKN